jgi:hypothetical protein
MLTPDALAMARVGLGQLRPRHLCRLDRSTNLPVQMCGPFGMLRVPAEGPDQPHRPVTTSRRPVCRRQRRSRSNLTLSAIAAGQPIIGLLMMGEGRSPTTIVAGLDPLTTSKATSRSSTRAPALSLARQTDVGGAADQRFALSQSTIRSWASSIQQPQLLVTQ